MRISVAGFLYEGHVRVTYYTTVKGLIQRVLDTWNLE